MKSSYRRLYAIALGLSVFTIIYNTAEGLVSVVFGSKDETLTLFGFGLDSIIEVISGIGIFIMIRRIQMAEQNSKSRGEINALRITGYSFYSLVVLLLLSSIASLLANHKPVTTRWGIIISTISIIIMTILARIKIATGKKLNSLAIIADGRCTMVCVYMSIVLLVSSFIFQMTKIAYADIVGSLALCWFCFKEGREALESSRNIHKNGCC